MTSDPLRVLQWFDFVLLALALPIFVAADLPLIGWAVVAVVWTIQRVAQHQVDRRVEASDDPRVAVGLAAGSMIARGWAVAIALFLTYLADHDAGLPAAVLVLALFTVYFTINIVLRPLQKGRMHP